MKASTQCAAEQIPFPISSFNLVCALVVSDQMTLHHFESQSKVSGFFFVVCDISIASEFATYGLKVSTGLIQDTRLRVLNEIRHGKGIASAAR